MPTEVAEPTWEETSPEAAPTWDNTTAEAPAEEPKPKQSKLAAAGNALAREAVRGVGNLLQGVETISYSGPGATMHPDATPEVRQAEQQNLQRLLKQFTNPATVREQIVRGPAYQTGKDLVETAPETYPVDAEREKEFTTKAAGMVGGFLPLVASGPAAPLTIGAQSVGAHMQDDFESLQQQGMSEDDAARETMRRATNSGMTQAAIFAAVPGPLKKVLDKVFPVGASTLGKIVINRTMAATEGAVLGAGSKAAENVVSDKPVTEDIVGSGAALGAMNLVLPYSRGRDGEADRLEGELGGGEPKEPKLLRAPTIVTPPPETMPKRFTWAEAEELLRNAPRHPEADLIPPSRQLRAPAIITPPPEVEPQAPRNIVDIEWMLRDLHPEPEPNRIEGSVVKPEILDRINEKGATKAVAVQRIFPALQLNETEAATLLRMAQERAAGTKRPDVQTPENEAAARSGDVSEATRTEQPQPAGGKETVTPAAEPVKPVRVAMGQVAKTRFDNETAALEGQDILAWIKDHAPLASKSEARRSKGLGWWARNGSLYDDAPGKLPPHHNLIYQGGNMPDVVAEAAYRDGMLKSPDVGELWQAIRKASDTRNGLAKQSEKFNAAMDVAAKEHSNWLKATKQGELRVTADDLAPGDVLEVGGERVTVKARDPDTGDIIIEDGKKFGVQKVEGGESIYVEKLHDVEGAGEVDWNPEPVETPTQPDLLDRADAALKDRLDDIKREGRLRAFGDPEVAALWVARGAVHIAKGVRDFAAWSKQMVAEAGEAIRPHLKDLFEQSRRVAEGTHPTIGLSERGIKLTGDEQIAEQVRDALNSGYAKRTNETDKQFAQRLVLDAGGAQAAAQRWLNGDFDSRPSAVKTILGSEIQKQLATRERALRGQGKTAEADAIVSAQVQLAQHDIARATDLAQGLQAFNTHYMDWSPAAWLKHFRSSIGRLAAERVSVATGKETGTSGVEVSKAVTDAVAEELAPKQPKLARTLREQFGGEMDGKPLAERLERNGQAKPGKGKKLADELTKFYRNEVKKFRRRYNVPEFDAATEKDILQRANRINGLPEDSVQRREAALDLFRHMTRLKGFEWWELPLDFWYANILSGPTTHVKNILGNTVNVGAEAAVQMLRNPSAIPSILEAVGRSLPVAKREAVNIMRTGHDTAGRHGNKFEAPGVLENIENPIASKLLMPWKMVGRALKAEDVGFFYPLQEMKASVLASRQARAEGVPLYGGARAKRVRAILAWDAQAKAKAEIQAQREGLTGSLLERRVQELREQSRPPQLMESARDFAFLGTFNNDVYGILGTLTNAWSAAAQKVPGLKLVVPFTRIVANLSNSMLNWTPVGYYRGARAQGLKLLFGRPDNTGKLYGHAVTDPTAIGDLYTRSTLGTVALVAVAAGAAQYLFDANPNFMVTAQGPSDPDQRKLLQEAGWIPYSLKVGNRYYSYQDKPLAFGLSMVGHYLDAMRYRKLDQQDALNRVAYAFSAAGNVILNSSWLQGLSSIFNTANRDSTKSPLQAVPRQAIKTGSAFVVPNALKQLDQLFDDTKYSADDVREMMLREVPFARANNQLDLNVFGEPIHQPLSKIWMSKVEGDGLVQMLAGRRLWPSVPVDGGLSPAETYALMKYRGPMLRRELGQRLGDIATLPHAEARKLVEGISRQATDRAKKDLGLDDVSRLKRDQLKRSER